MRGALIKFFKQLSLATRLALLFGAAAAAVFTVAGIHLYQASAEQLRRRDDIALRGAAELLKHHIEEIPSLEVLRRDPHHLLDVALAQRGLSFAVWNGSGELVTTSSPEAASLRARHRFSAGERPLEIADGVTGAGKPLRATVARVRVGKTADEVSLVVAHEEEQRQELLRGYRDDLLWTALLGAVITALLGYVIARHGLRRIKTIADTSGEITAARLDTRLSVQDAPPEFAEMMHSINQMLDRLEDSFRRLRQFSSDIAHDLRTPLSNLMVQTQVMLSRPRSRVEYEELLASNIEELERLSRMVEEMLFLARVDNPSTVIDRNPVELRAELDKVTEFYSPLAQELNLTITCSGMGTVRGDRALLQRAIHNLLSNALRYSSPGGTIAADIVPTEGWVELSITNPGPGIAEEHLAHVFDRFYRTDAARQKSEDGAGLGLAIFKSIVQLHGGAVDVQSTPSETTKFSMRLPAAT